MGTPKFTLRPKVHMFYCATCNNMIATYDKHYYERNKCDMRIYRNGRRVECGGTPEYHGINERPAFF